MTIPTTTDQLTIPPPAGHGAGSSARTMTTTRGTPRTPATTTRPRSTRGRPDTWTPNDVAEDVQVGVSVGSVTTMPPGLMPGSTSGQLCRAGPLHVVAIAGAVR